VHPAMKNVLARQFSLLYQNFQKFKKR